MGKIIFDEPNQNITIKLYNFKDSRASLHLSPKFTLNTLATHTLNETGIGGVTEIEVTNGTNLTVEISKAPLNSIIVRDNSTLVLRNNYTGNTKAKIIAEKSSVIAQTGIDLPIEHVALYSDATFNFTHKGSAYILHNNDINCSTQSSANSGITINVIEADIRFIAETAVKLKNIFFDFKIFDFEVLKLYKRNEKILNIFIEQNNLSSDIDIKSYISQNYFEFTGIAKSLKYSNLEKLPVEVMCHITSFLNLSDVMHPPISLEPAFITEATSKLIGQDQTLASEK